MVLLLLTASRSGNPVFGLISHRDGAYSVSMSPMGEVRFPHTPKRVVTLDANYNDMLVAAGQGKTLLATGYRGNFYDGFYSELSRAK